MNLWTFVCEAVRASQTRQEAVEEAYQRGLLDGREEVAEETQRCAIHGCRLVRLAIGLFECRKCYEESGVGRSAAPCWCAPLRRPCLMRDTEGEIPARYLSPRNLLVTYNATKRELPGAGPHTLAVRAVQRWKFDRRP